MDLLHDLLSQIEDGIDNSPVTLKDAALYETEKAYTYNALGICLNKLNNKICVEGKEGIMRTKAMFEKIHGRG